MEDGEYWTFRRHCMGMRYLGLGFSVLTIASYCWGSLRMASLDGRDSHLSSVPVGIGTPVKVKEGAA